MHAAAIYDAGEDDKLMFFFHGPKVILSIFMNVEHGGISQ